MYARLSNPNDSTEVYYAVTDARGIFTFLAIRPQSYFLDLTYVGYTKVSKTVVVDKQNTDLGTFEMSETTIPLGEVVVQGTMPAAIQKADTTEFMAKAFRTNPDADAQDLIAKMPGITVDNTGVKALGEDIQQVLVDGKPFFGGDPTLALHNLPADAIEKIQVFDKMSDQAEFTGFDDGQSVKTINIILRPEKRNSQFGKYYGGYGDDGHYLTGGSGNVFDNDMKLSLIGLSNNVNQQNFSTQDLLGVLGSTGQRGAMFAGNGVGRQGMGRGGGGGGNFIGGFQGGGGNGGASIGNFLIGQQSGITSTSSVGTNYTDNWGGGVSVSQSYFFNSADNRNTQGLTRTYFSNVDSVNLYNQRTDADGKNYNHRLDGRYEFAPDTSNSIIDQPKLYFQNNHQTSVVAGSNALTPLQILNQAENDNATTTTGNNLSNHLVLRHKFDIPGRTISLDFGATSNTKNGSGTLLSSAEYFTGSPPQYDTLNQRTGLVSSSASLSARVAYTEPIMDATLLQLSWNPTYSKNNSDNRRFSYDPVTQTYASVDTGLSNTYNNTYSTNNAGAGLRFRGKSFNVMADVVYQTALLQGDQIFPFGGNTSKRFYAVLPALTMNFNITDHSNLRLFYRTTSSAPSISQLQNVVDNSNPLILSTGNPDLKQSYNYTLMSRFALTNVGTAQGFFVLFTATHTANYVGTLTLTSQRDSVLAQGIPFNRGTQLTIPVNLEGYWTGRTFLTYSLPVTFIRSIMNLNGGVTYARTPGLVDELYNYSSTLSYSLGEVWSSNISDEIDFSLGYTGNYNTTRNTLQPNLNSDYYNHNVDFKLNLIFWNGVVYRSEVMNTLYSGLTGGYDQNLVIWNMSLAKKFLSNKAAELSFGVTDLLNQNKSVTRTVTDSYIEDAQNLVLGRTLMLTFTYTLR